MTLEQLLARSKGMKPTEVMANLLNLLPSEGIVPQPDKYYVFVYKAKTPNISYDQHPFVVVTSIFQWGFVGYNFHWGQPRRYTWAEIKSNIYEVSDDQLNVVEELPIALFKTS